MCVVLMLFIIGVYVFYQKDDVNSNLDVKKNDRASAFHFIVGDSKDKSEDVNADDIKSEKEKSVVDAFAKMFDNAKNIKIGSNYNSMSDITEDMIKNRSLGENVTMYSSNYDEHWFKVEVVSFTGANYSKILRADKKTKITLHYNNTMKEDTFQLVLITADNNLVYLPLDKEEYSCTVPKGDNVLALVGVKAKGKVEVTLEPKNNVKFVQEDSE